MAHLVVCMMGDSSGRMTHCPHVLRGTPTWLRRPEAIPAGGAKVLLQTAPALVGFELCCEDLLMAAVAWGCCDWLCWQRRWW